MQDYNHDSISATELVRNLSAFIDKVRISGQSLYITKGSQTVAELMPPPKLGYPIAKLTNLLNTLPKLKDDARLMREDLTQIKKNASLPESPWD